MIEDEMVAGSDRHFHIWQRKEERRSGVTGPATLRVEGEGAGAV